MVGVFAPPISKQVIISDTSTNTSSTLPSITEATTTKVQANTEPIVTIPTTTATYLVTKVVDGDTFDVSINGTTERLRMIGIDTPETVDPRKPVQCFGKEASAKTTELLLGKSVTLEADSTQGERDKYNRLLRYAFLPDGKNFALVLIQEGYAYEYTYDTPYKYQQSFKDAERMAREGKKGLWADGACADIVQSVTSTASTSVPSSSTTQPAAPAGTTDGPPVKKATSSGKCHAKGTTYYNQTKNYTSYNTIQECLDSGGTLPK